MKKKKRNVELVTITCMCFRMCVVWVTHTCLSREEDRNTRLYREESHLRQRRSSRILGSNGNTNPDVLLSIYFPFGCWRKL